MIRRSWVLEGSNDKVNWIELDSHTKDFILCSKSEIRTFIVQDKSKCEHLLFTIFDGR